MRASVRERRQSMSLSRRYFEAARANWAVVLAVLVLVLFVVVPLALLLITSFKEGTPGRLGEWTLDNYQDSVSSSLVFEAFRNTIGVATVATIISLLLAGFFAWLVERSDMPFRNLAFTILLLPIAVPSILFVLAWTVLLAPRTGLINVPLRDVLQFLGVDLAEGPFNIYSLGGVIFLDSLRGVTTIFLMLVAAFRLFDSTLEEAAKVSGAGTFHTLRRITIPLLAPAILAAAMYSFISSLDQFEAALAAGLPGQIFLLPTLIFFTVQLRSPADYGLSAVYSVYFMLLMILLLFVYRRIVSKSERFVTVTGKAYRPEPVPLGKWRYPAFAAVALFGVATVLLPAAVLAWLSLLPPNTALTLGNGAPLSLDIYANIFTNPRTITIAWNTLVMLAVTATITMGIAFLVSWAIVRGKGRARGLLDGLSFLPYAFPGVTVAIALIFVFLNPPGNYFRIYGSISILVLGLTVIYIAFATRLMNGAIAQIGKELEEAGRTSGATQLAVMRRITLPLLTPAFIAGWIWVASHAMRSFSVPLVLSSQRNQVIAPEIWRVWQRGYLSEAAAYGVILMIILIPITVWMRRLMGSLEVGGAASRRRRSKAISRWTSRLFSRRFAEANVGEIR
jgi:iron(III) transport system permease protein